MEIRLHGTRAEVEQAAARLRLVFNVIHRSRPRKDRNGSLYRLYLTVLSPTDPR
ncbi:hypothetical protein LI90_3030 [Carbonactinospora thermoautotrophica]|uniref:Uncharacterized protein n=1 Tax=Carbonactinospora thermoautotrophica TaxID=1469144 RepID=A0A132MVR5_9ACTN|nr:hypothetical protein [Carbonactinospora thermoautotrophica]KWX01995.1 hypothetical protein LI90_3030 [Carbonactinospora thermoautotrophica]